MEKFVRASITGFDINSLNCVSLPGYTFPCILRSTDINLQTFQNKVRILSVENSIRGGISTIMGDRNVKSRENKNIL